MEDAESPANVWIIIFREKIIGVSHVYKYLIFHPKIDTFTEANFTRVYQGSVKNQPLKMSPFWGFGPASLSLGRGEPGSGFCGETSFLCVV